MTHFIAYLLLALLVLFIVRKILSLFKFPKVGSFCLITGAVKSGKTTFGVGLAISEYKRAHRRWKFRKFFQKMFKLGVDEEPLFYSNIPLAVPYVPVTKGILTRTERVPPKSIVYLSEASLVADNNIYKNSLLNEQIMLFCKLFGHMSHGGICIYDTQAIGDLPAVTRRCISQYFYVHHTVKWIPFFIVVYVREDRYSEDGTVISTYTEDVEDKLKRVVMRKSVWKKFDCYCYSCFTDDKQAPKDVVTLSKTDSLKATDIVSFKEYRL